MSKNVIVDGQTYNGVQKIEAIDASTNQYVSFVDTSDATALSNDITIGKTAYVDGSKIIGTNTGGSSDSVYSGVTFINYDGSILYRWKTEDVLAAEDFPDLEIVHPSGIDEPFGIKWDGWNWTLAQLKSELTEDPERIIYVGSLYRALGGTLVTSLGNTYVLPDNCLRIVVNIPENNFTQVLGLIRTSNAFDIYWGDLSEPESLVSGSQSHTYALAGEYSVYVYYRSNLNESYLKNLTIRGYTYYDGSAQMTQLYGNGKSNLSASPDTIVAVNIPRSYFTVGDFAFCQLHNLEYFSFGCIEGDPDYVGDTSASSAGLCLVNGTTIKQITLPHGVQLGTKSNTAYGISYGCLWGVYGSDIEYVCLPRRFSPPKSSSDTMWDVFYRNFRYIPSYMRGFYTSSVIFNSQYKTDNIEITTFPSSVRAYIEAFNLPSGGSDLSFTFGGYACPQKITGQGVYSGKLSIRSNPYIEGVILNDPVEINSNAFSYCGRLKSVNVNGNFNSIGSSAFSYCGLEEFEVPNSVTSIGVNAFSYCPNMKRLSLGSGCSSTMPGIARECPIEEFESANEILDYGSYFFYGWTLPHVNLENAITVSESCFSSSVGKIDLGEKVIYMGKGFPMTQNVPPVFTYYPKNPTFHSIVPPMFNFSSGDGSYRVSSVCVPYESMGEYAPCLRSNYNYSSPPGVVGFTKPNTFSQGDTLPNTSPDGFSVRWVDDKGVTATTVTDPSKPYYAAAVPYNPGSSTYFVFNALKLKTFQKNCAVTITNSTGTVTYTDGDLIPKNTSVLLSVTPNDISRNHAYKIVVWKSSRTRAGYGNPSISPENTIENNMYEYTAGDPDPSGVSISIGNINYPTKLYVIALYDDYDSSTGTTTIPVDSTLGNNSWFTIKEVSDAGVAPYIWATVTDNGSSVAQINIENQTKDITITKEGVSTQYTARLVDVQRGRYRNKNVTNSTNTVFEFTECLSDIGNVAPFDTSNSDGNYGSSNIQSILNDDVFPYLDSDVKSVITELAMPDPVGNDNYIKHYYSKLFIPASGEIYSTVGSDSTSKVNGTVYSPFYYYYRHSGNSYRIKTLDGVNSKYWTRTLNTASTWYIISASGSSTTASNTGANAAVAPCFAI